METFSRYSAMKRLNLLLVGKIKKLFNKYVPKNSRLVESGRKRTFVTRKEIKK